MSTANTAGMTVTQQGSITRMAIGQPEAAPAAVPYEANKVSQGTARLNMGHGEVTQAGVTRYQAGQDRPTGSVMATRQNVNGHDTIELEPGNPASRTHLKAALAAGLVEPVGSGEYRDKGTPEGTTGPAADAPADGLEDAPADPGKGVFSPEEDKDWAADIEPLPQHAYDAAVASVTVALLSGASSPEKAAQNLAEQAAIPMELAMQYVDAGYAMHERIVAREVASLGVTDKESFYTWARESKSKALQNAIQQLTLARNVTPFRHLALEFKSRSR